MSNKEKEYNRHHRCPRSRYGDTNNLNCEYIVRSTHNAIHTLFANDIFPEQIERLTNMTSRVLRPEVVQELLEVLSYRDIHNPEDWYKDGVLLLPKRHRCWRDNTDTE